MFENNTSLHKSVNIMQKYLHFHTTLTSRQQLFGNNQVLLSLRIKIYHHFKLTPNETNLSGRSKLPTSECKRQSGLAIGIGALKKLVSINTVACNLYLRFSSFWVNKMRNLVLPCCGSLM